jgi:O-antigen/teichoic acid export membrane protein
MKTLLRRVRSHPRYSKIFEWGMLISVMGSAQMMIQGLGLLSGFLIVHMLTTEEYAYYTLAYTMFGTLVALADAGISNGVLAHGAKNWRDEQALGKVVVTGIALRRKFALISLAVSFPILFVLLTRHGAAWQFSLLILLALGPTFYASLTEDLLEIPSKLHQDILTLQKNQLVANGGRLVFLGIGLFALPWAAMAILANGLPRIWANIQLRKIAEKFTDFSQPEQAQIRTDILKMVKRALPGAIYYCLSSQLSIWLISIYGNTESIAQIGALGRLAAILTVVGAMFSTLIVPRFARQPERAAGLLRSFFLVMAVLVLICVIGSGLAYLFPEQMLFLLGKNYGGLNEELFLSVLGNCISMVVGVVYALLISRTWILMPVINISLSILMQILLISTLDLSNAKGVLIYSLLNALWALAMYAAYFFFRIAILRKSEKTAAAT